MPLDYYLIMTLLSSVMGFSCELLLAGITGPVAIDALGDRIADFDIFHMQDPNTRIFTVTDFLQHLSVKMTTYSVDHIINIFCLVY